MTETVQARDRDSAPLDVSAIRADFPILAEKMYGKDLVFLDSAASAQKPRQVIDAISTAYETAYANVHRGAYRLSGLATDAFEAARKKAQRFLNAASEKEIIFTRNTTEGINLVAASYGRKFLKEGDEVLITHMEHHSNIVPWQLLREQTGIVLRVAPIDDDGNLIMAAFADLVTERTKMIAVTHVSNALGTVVPVDEICQMARERSIVTLIDGSQAVPHIPVDVRDIGCDFYVFTGHKVYGPSGIGVLYGRAELLDAMPPYQGGGEMIRTVTFEKSTFADLPHKFEAGTPNIVGAIGLGAALDYVSAIGPERIAANEAQLLAYGMDRLARVPGLRLIGTAQRKLSVMSFIVEGVHAHDVGTVLDSEGIAIRSGHHCAQPVMDRFGLTATARASLGVYSSIEDIDALVAGLAKVREIFG
ncbi:MAG: cysteine desulfurase [Alphaproteobacteria bacterium]|nr:cysteine desulfurase [Alphaproteobacteria bacterium]